MKLTNLRLPTMKELESKGGTEAFDWLASLEREFKSALADTPVADIRTRRKLQKRLDRLQERREEFKQSRQPRLESSRR